MILICAAKDPSTGGINATVRFDGEADDAFDETIGGVAFLLADMLDDLRVREGMRDDGCDAIATAVCTAIYHEIARETLRRERSRGEDDLSSKRE